MGMGAETSISASGEAAGSQYAGQLGQGAGGFNPMGSSGSSSAASGTEGVGTWANIKKMLSDPETLKALGEFTKNMGHTVGSAQKLPPQVAQMFQSALQGPGSPGPQSGSAPFLGDIASFFDPKMAGAALTSMGIPIGRG